MSQLFYHKQHFFYQQKTHAGHMQLKLFDHSTSCGIIVFFADEFPFWRYLQPSFHDPNAEEQIQLETWSSPEAHHRIREALNRPVCGKGWLVGWKEKQLQNKRPSEWILVKPNYCNLWSKKTGGPPDGLFWLRQSKLSLCYSLHPTSLQSQTTVQMLEREKRSYHLCSIITDLLSPAVVWRENCGSPMGTKEWVRRISLRWWDGEQP